MVLLKLLQFFGPFLGFFAAWIFVRNANSQIRRKRAEILLVLMPFVCAIFLFVSYLIFH